MASGEHFQRIHYNLRLGATTAGKIVNDTCCAIWKILSPQFMPLPSTDGWLNIEKEFDKLWNFPNCIGAIDGKHIAIQCPTNSGSSYYNYKGHHSIVLQAVVDANAKFIFIDVGDFGRNSDGGVLKESNFGKLLDNNKLLLPPPRKIHEEVEDKFPFVFVADEAYPLKKNLMKPFARKQLTNSKRIFNYRQSRARRIVECAFGILTKRFNVFENKMLVNPEKATIITQAACVLHNLIMDKEHNLNDIHNEMEKISSRVNHEDINKPTNRRPTTEVIDIRKKFMIYFNSEIGSVPWQNVYTV